MTVDIERYKQLAQQKQGEHRKFLANLKKKAPKNLDRIVQDIHAEVFSEIDCTECANCCKTLGPLFTEADITRIAKHLHMKLPVLRICICVWMRTEIRYFNPCPVPSLEAIIYVVSMMLVPKPVENFRIPTARRFIKSTI